MSCMLWYMRRTCVPRNVKFHKCKQNLCICIDSVYCGGMWTMNACIIFLFWMATNSQNLGICWYSRVWRVRSDFLYKFASVFQKWTTQIWLRTIPRYIIYYWMLEEMLENNWKCIVYNRYQAKIHINRNLHHSFYMQSLAAMKPTSSTFRPGSEIASENYFARNMK